MIILLSFKCHGKKGQIFILTCIYMPWDEIFLNLRKSNTIQRAIIALLKRKKGSK